MTGGGGRGDAGGGTSPPPAPPPAPGGGNPPPTAGASGRLWHNNYALDIVTGTQVANLDNSPPTLVDPDLFAVPWPDGSQYVVTDYRPSRGETTITVKEAGTRRTLFEVIYGGYAGSPQPSPVSKEVLLMTLGEISVGPADYGFINLRTRSFIDRFSDASTSIDWLPDGRAFNWAPTAELPPARPAAPATQPIHSTFKAAGWVACV